LTSSARSRSVLLSFPGSLPRGRFAVVDESEFRLIAIEKGCVQTGTVRNEISGHEGNSTYDDRSTFEKAQHGSLGSTLSLTLTQQ